jgi:hypothetical protein
MEEIAMKAEPRTEHQWLQKFVGEWTCEAEMKMKPDEPPVTSKATEVARSLGGLWILAEGQGEMPGGGSATTLMTLGYDPDRNRFVGTWVGSMMTYMWVYDGALDAAGTTLTLDTKGPSMAGDGKMSSYQDVIEFKSDDHRILSSQVLGDDGQWHRFMTAHYRRKR